MAGAFADSKGRYGYRRIKAMLRTGVSEKALRRIMAEDGLTAHVPERRGYGSYEGEATPAPGDLADRDFTAEMPNEKWLTDITELKARAGPASRSPLVHSDRGCHCRRPVRLALMDRYGPVRSTGAKGRSPDDTAEGFLGRIRTESVYPGH